MSINQSGKYLEEAELTLLAAEAVFNRLKYNNNKREYA